MLSVGLVTGVSLLYLALLFSVAYYADKRQELGKSVISTPHVYSLSIAIYATSWYFYGAVGNAATTGIDFVLLDLGPTLCAFTWWFLLRKIVRIGKENNITSIADFISSRYGKSQTLGALITILAMLAMMPYIALQLKAVSATFDIICGYPRVRLPFTDTYLALTPYLGLAVAFILSFFGVVFGARRLVSSERHEGLVAVIAIESIVKLITLVIVGVFVTYFMFDGFSDIFSRMQARNPQLLNHLFTIEKPGEASYARWFAMLYLSMGAVILLPRQFQMMVIENTNEEHIKEAMWGFPAYLFLSRLFVVPIALGGILYTGSQAGADYFVLTLPLKSGHRWLSLLAFLGGFSAAAGMVIVESVALSTMFLNHLIMPIIVRFKPRTWFSTLLINLKRCAVFLVVFLGYFYYQAVGETYQLVNIGLISFIAVAQFGPALIGGLYWPKGNRTGAITGISLGFIVWCYTLLLPSFIQAGWWQSDILREGPFGIDLLKPTELFGLTDFDLWTHSLFWSMFFNAGGYLACSILFPQTDREEEQVGKFVYVFAPPGEEGPRETKRLSKPVTIVQFVNLMAKFIGREEAHAAIGTYLGDREVNESGGVSEFELPGLKRFTEKTLAGFVGAAAAGAIVESFLSGMGSSLEPVYDIYSKVRADLKESRENLYVRLRASEIMNRSLDLRAIMDELLDLLCREFRFDLATIRIMNEKGMLAVRTYSGTNIPSITGSQHAPDITTYIGDAFLSNEPRFINDPAYVVKPETKALLETEGVSSFAHIPITREGATPLGVLSVHYKTSVGLFTPTFLDLLSSLAGQLAQVMMMDAEMKARERERKEKEKILHEMEIAKQIQLSLLPAAPPDVKGIRIACRCVPATHVGGDYYDFFQWDDRNFEMAIADVSGHSVGAALIMAETRSALRAQTALTKRSGKILSDLNDLLYDDLTRAELFISMFYAKYSVDGRLLTYSNAGHPPPLLLRHGDASCTELDAEGLILGVKKGVNFEEKSSVLQENDILLLYTDGITEAQSEAGEFFGTGRLCGILDEMRDEPPDRIIAAVLEKIEDFTRSATFVDDVTMVLLKV
jgi:sigma-B regulation protein RsbU (phosphoserine phosphatase)